MRIIGQLSHPTIKITLFTHNEKLSVKFEKHQAEIILKFKEDQQQVLQNLHEALAQTQFQKIETQLNELLAMRATLEPPVSQDDEFLEIM